MRPIKLNLLENGLDFLNEALPPIIKSKDERQLKYSVLHICAGVELILKKILYDVNWQWIFLDIEKAKKEDLETGNFQSVKFDELVKRLSTHAGYDIPAETIMHLRELKTKRNKIEHYAITGETASGLRGNISVVLLDVIDLIRTHIKLDTPHAETLFEKISKSAVDFKEFTDQIVVKYKPDLERAERGGAKVMQCPDCFQPVLTVYPAEESECLFCKYHATPEQLADDYLEKIEGVCAFETIKDGGEYPLYDCLECNIASLVRNNDGSYFCFNCHSSWPLEGLRFCGTCGQIYEVNDDDIDMCFNCIKDRFDKID